MGTSLTVRCCVASMVLADGEIVGRGDQFELPYTDDPEGRKRVQDYVDAGYVKLDGASPAWWSDRPPMIRLQALCALSYSTKDGRQVRWGDVFEVPASTRVPHLQNGMTERDIAQHIVSSGCAVLVDPKPPWWRTTTGTNVGKPLPAP